MADQAPESSAAVRLWMLRKVDDRLAGHVDRAGFTTRITADRRAETAVRMPWQSGALANHQLFDWDKQAAEALRALPGADSSIPLGSPGRTYTVTWDGVRAPV